MSLSQLTFWGLVTPHCRKGFGELFLRPMTKGERRSTRCSSLRYYFSFSSHVDTNSSLRIVALFLNMQQSDNLGRVPKVVSLGLTMSAGWEILDVSRSTLKP